MNIWIGGLIVTASNLVIVWREMNPNRKALSHEKT